MLQLKGNMPQYHILSEALYYFVIVSRLRHIDEKKTKTLVTLWTVLH